MRRIFLNRLSVTTIVFMSRMRCIFKTLLCSLLDPCLLGGIWTYINHHWHLSHLVAHRSDRSHDPIWTFDPASTLHCTQGTLCEPLGIRGKGRKEEGDNSFNPIMNALLLSWGDIEKMLQAFPQQSAKQRGPWEMIYSVHAKYCTSLAHTPDRNRIFELYFSYCRHFHIQ